MIINTNVKKISDTLLLQQTDYLVQQERETTILILRHLREVEVRRLYIDLEYSSMHKYCIKKLKYTEGQAQRRIASARLLIELPEIEQQIQDGNLNLTNLSNIQSFVRAEKSVNCSLDRNQKLELINSLESKSTREVQRELVKRSNQPMLLAETFKMSSHELEMATTNNGQNLGVIYQKFESFLGPEQQELLQEFKNFYAHELSDMSNHSVLTFLLEKAVAHKKKKLGLIPKQTNNAPPPSAPKVKAPQQRKPVNAMSRRLLWQRANGCCEYLDNNTKSRCNSKFALEEDHIQPVALGGTNDLTNLQLLCREHNSRRSIKTFGVYRT